MRRERQLTQQQVADDGDLGRKYPSQVERGELNPGLDAMVALARGLGVPVATLFDGVAQALAAEDGG